MSFSKIAVSACAVVVAACGMKVNINGKSRVIGGGAREPAPDAAMPNATKVATPGEAASTFQTQTIAIDAALSNTPIVADFAAGITLSTRLASAIGGAYAPCGNTTTDKAIAVLVLRVPQPNGQVTVTGVPGFVLVRGKRFWSSCDSTVRPEEGLEAGSYEVFPLMRTSYDKPVVAKSIAVGVSDPTKAPVWSDRVKRISIPAKLETPLIVEVAMGTDRQVRGEGLHGSGCGGAAFRIEPDLALELARPIKGLRIRPAPSKEPPTLRMTRPATSAGTVPRPSCARARAELRVRDGEEGTFGISVGLPRTAPNARSVMLLIYDDSTTLDPLTLMPLPGPLEMKHRELAYHFPFLTDAHLRLDNYARAEIAAKVFKTAPAEALVYAKLDFDKEIAQSAANYYTGDRYPHKNEPLLVYKIESTRSRVLAQDGFTYQVKTSHLLAAPDGESAPLAAPRPLSVEYDPDGTRVHAAALLPPGNEKLARSLYEMDAARTACVNRVSAPYNRRLPTITRPANVDIVVVRSPRSQAIIDARNTAIARKCGTLEAHTKKKQAQYRVILRKAEEGREALFELARR